MKFVTLGYIIFIFLVSWNKFSRGDFRIKWCLFINHSITKFLLKRNFYAINKTAEGWYKWCFDFRTHIIYKVHFVEWNRMKISMENNEMSFLNPSCYEYCQKGFIHFLGNLTQIPKSNPGLRHMTLFTSDYMSDWFQHQIQPLLGTWVQFSRWWIHPFWHVIKSILNNLDLVEDKLMIFQRHASVKKRLISSIAEGVKKEVSWMFPSLNLFNTKVPRSSKKVGF